MSDPSFLDPRLTERRNPRTVDLDTLSALELVDRINAEDRAVPDALAAAREELARGVELVVRVIQNGGRLIYVGAGTSGRLGVLDASECPPTFGTPPELVVGVIAGGAQALVRSQEGAEDDVEAGGAAMDAKAVTARDVVVGIAASGTTPFVRSALARAQTLGAATALITCAEAPAVLRETCDVIVTLRVGPEVVTGSTRMKAGTATKLALNTLTTAAMVRLGKTYGNLMVDLRTLSAKLQDRAERIVMEVAGLDRATARATLAQAGGRAKLAIVMARRGVDAAGAERLLADAGGLVRGVIGDPPPVTP